MRLRALTYRLCSHYVFYSRGTRLRNRCLETTGVSLNYYFSTHSKGSRVGFNDYETECLNFNSTVPERFNFASDVLDVWAQKEKDFERKLHSPAFWFVFQDGTQEKWSFQELAMRSKRTASMLEKLCGIQRWDNVMVLLPKIPAFWLVNIAAIRIGAILSSGSMQLTAKDIKYRFDKFQPTCIIADESIASSVDEVADSCSTLKTKIIVSENKNSKQGWLDFYHLYEKASPEHQCVDTGKDDSMMVFFTSGTTGLPKMVEHSHSSYGFSLGLTGRYWLDLTSDNILWNLSDTGWAKTAYSNIFAPWLQGACVFVHQMRRFKPSSVVKVLAEFPIDTLCAPPTAYRMLVQENLQGVRSSNLRHCLSAGEPLNPEIIRQWMDGTSLPIYEGYGQTETVLLLGMYKCLKYKPGSIGKPSPGMEIAILDENGNELGPGKEGEIAVKMKPKSPGGLFKGYKNDPEKTASRLTEEYFKTGDVAYYDDEGFYWFVGRNDDLINSSGYRIGPFEVESALIEHPYVVEAAVVSCPDPTRGEVVKAFVVLKEEYMDKSEADVIKELQEHVKKVTAPYKYPRKIEFVKDLPKTTSGKIKRFELKMKEWKCAPR